MNEQFTKYEIARIIGARALQIAMDAPVLIKISEEELKAMRYDSIKIAELEFEKGALPITIKRPFPKKRAEKLKAVKAEEIDDEKIIAKEKEEEKEIVEKAEEMGFVQEDDQEITDVTPEENGE